MLSSPEPQVTLTQSRFWQLIDIERTAGDVNQILIDLGGSHMDFSERMIDIDAVAGLPAAVLITALGELQEALLGPGEILVA